MLAKAIFLAFCSTSLAFLNLDRPPTENLGFGDSSQGVWRTPDFASGEEQSPTKSRNSELGTGTSIGTLQELTGSKTENLNPQKIKNLKGNWKANEIQLNSLRQDSEALSAIIGELERLEPNFILATTNHRQLEQAIHELGKFKARIKLFKQWRLLELGKADLSKSNSELIALINGARGRKKGLKTKQMETFDNLPPDMVGIIAKKRWQNLGFAMMNDLKKLMKSKKRFPQISNSRALSEIGTTSARFSILCWNYAFKIIDFLLQNDFVDRSSFELFFHDPTIIRAVIGYVEMGFSGGIKKSILGETSYLITEHWYWPFWENPFKALGRREQDLLNAYLLLDFRHRKFVTDANLQTPMFRSLRVFLSDFDPKWYLSELKGQAYLKKSPHSTEMVPIGYSKNYERKEKIIIDTRRIMKIIGNTEGGCWKMIRLRRHLFHILDFIEQKISPGVIAEISSKNSFTQIDQEERLWKFDNIFNLVRFQDKLRDLDFQANHYYKYIKSSYPDDWSRSSLYKENYNTYLAQLINLKTPFSLESERLLQKLARTFLYTPIKIKIKALQRKFDNVLKHLKETKNFFLIDQ